MSREEVLREVVSELERRAEATPPTSTTARQGLRDAAVIVRQMGDDT